MVQHQIYRKLIEKQTSINSFIDTMNLQVHLETLSEVLLDFTAIADFSRFI
ncbi:DUF4351 domain-containing protein [Nostoc edaphicum]|uniref:DUF4351 domain-containing protein n=1 Tax=Nostoc edaphicum TaxID=264686 RepID=UPI003907F609